MDELLTGEKITLRVATAQDKRKIFEWLTKSNLTKEMMGPPDYPDAKIPTWEEFSDDYQNHYFDSSAPLLGQCFISTQNGKDIGQINYNAIDMENKRTDLNIWLSDKKYTGRGIGTEAIRLLCSYLHKNFGCEQIVISPSKRNKRAIRAYEKAGFVLTDIELKKAEKDFTDNVVLIKNMLGY